MIFYTFKFCIKRAVQWLASCKKALGELSRVSPASHPKAAATVHVTLKWVSGRRGWVGGWVDKKVKMMQSCFDNFSATYLTNYSAAYHTDAHSHLFLLTCGTTLLHVQQAVPTLL